MSSMKTSRPGIVLGSIVFLAVAMVGLSDAQPSASATVLVQAANNDKVLFDFENEADLKDWSNLDIAPAIQKEWEQAVTAAQAASKPAPRKPATAPAEPPVKLELTADGATSGAKALKLTFAGGNWPAAATARFPIPIDDAWQEYLTFKADVTVARPCLVGFRIMQEKSRRAATWDGNISRWEKTCLLSAGKTDVVAQLHPINNYSVDPKWGKIVALEIYMYHPREGESIVVDNIRLGEERPPAAGKVSFQVLGTDMKVSGVAELLAKLKDAWTPQEDKPLDRFEADFARQFAEIAKAHPKAVKVVFRQGAKGFDAARPDQEYSGWADTHINSHGPDGNTAGISTNHSHKDMLETFMRHRSQLIRIDVSSIPRGSDILAAKLVVIRADPSNKDKPSKAPTMWVAEACNRPWVEKEVNGYEYARDKFWKTAGGMSAESYQGDDPDFLPLYLAYGPSQGIVNTWDFTQAVKFWTDGRHANCGFFLHGDSTDYIMAFSSKAKEVANRPMLMVIYEPPAK